MKVNSEHWDLWFANKMQQHYQICLQKRQGAEYGMHMIKELVILCFMIWIHIKQMKQSDYLKIIKQKSKVVTNRQIRWLVFFYAKLKGGMPVDEKEVFEICNQVDSFIAAELTESIVIGTSYDMLEAHYGILPISRNCFYRKRRIVQRIIKQRLGRIVEEQNGQLRMVW